MKRVFSKKCGSCGQRAMALQKVPYSIQIDHDGRKYTVNIPSLEVPKCASCGTISIDQAADEAIDNAFRLEANLLTPDQIRKYRLSLHLTQKDFADLICIAESTLSRWETGAQIQQRAMNETLVSFFELPEVRELYRQRRGLAAPSPAKTPVRTEDIVTGKMAMIQSQTIGQPRYKVDAEPRANTEPALV